MIYPDLPIVAKRQEIIAAIMQHPVVIIAGETGSGKTTQLPKMCIEAGFGQEGRWIGHTQPRRLAARTIAARIASELQCPLGTRVGYKIRFSDKTNETTQIKLMTDGILLQETHVDPRLSRYDVLIIDEAHERSLNIDFLMAYIKQLRAKRPDLKVIITSATIDLERFVDYFDQAPLIEISGRTYPVTTHYIDALPTEPDADLISNIVTAVQCAYAEGKGDILIFQSGEREIRETMEALEAVSLPHTTLLPLYARLPISEQQKVFQAYSGRKIIISTNVAETSVTVPNIRFVIDTGFVRINRYHYKSKIQRLMIEPISRSSAEQRKGRCGRVGPGICYRLYTEADLMTRDEFATPEILRTHLAGVILKLLDLGVKDIGHFPFMDPPEYRHIKDGLTLLHRLGAIDEHHRITPIGRKLHQFPMEPKCARMLIAADRQGALSEMLIITSFLSIVDPRERPHDQQQKADEKHAQYHAPDSDFMSILNLWNFIRSHKTTLSQQKFRKLCRSHFLSFIRICEWEDVYDQLKIKADELGLKCNTNPAAYESIHQSLLVGLLDGVGKKVEKRQYEGIRNSEFHIHPGSQLTGKPPAWIMSFELILTTKLYARMNAKIEPKWIETVAKPFLKAHYYEPHFDVASGRVLAFARLALFGLEIVSRRRVSYEQVMPQEARSIFIQEGLVEGKLQSSLPFYKHNQALISDLRELETRLRREQILLTDDTLKDFYEARIPSGVTSLQTLQQWMATTTSSVLALQPNDLLSQSERDRIKADFPDQWKIQEQSFDCRYRCDWEDPQDGVTIIIPLPLLNIAKKGDFSWPVPGHRLEKIQIYLKALPKPYRMMLPPVNEVAHTFAQQLTRAPGVRFETALLALVSQAIGRALPASTWDHIELPHDLKWHYEIHCEEGTVLKGDDLAVLAAQVPESVMALSTPHSPATATSGFTRWTFDAIPEKGIVKQDQYSLTHYYALVDHGSQVLVEGFDDPDLAAYHHRLGLARLYLCYCQDSVKQFYRNIKPIQKKTTGLRAALKEDLEALWDQVLLKAALTVFVDPINNIRDQVTFETQWQQEKRHFLTCAQTFQECVWRIVQQRAEIASLLSAPALANTPSGADLNAQLQGLFSEHWILNAPAEMLMRYPIYLKGMTLRIATLPAAAKRDQAAIAEIEAVNKVYQRKLAKVETDHLAPTDPLRLFRWKIEEFRISLFAQMLGTQETVSRVRLLKFLEKWE